MSNHKYKHLIQALQPCKQKLSKHLLYKEEFEADNLILNNLRANKHVLRIMTYNVHSFIDSSPKTITEQIKHINPDIYCLQELRNAKFQLEGYPFCSHCSSEGMFDNIIVSKYPIINHENIPIENLREANKVTIKLHNGKQIDIINTHMPLKSEERDSSIKTILEKVDNSNTIILGDMNSYKFNEYTCPGAGQEDIKELQRLKNYHGWPDIFEVPAILNHMAFTDSFDSHASIFGHANNTKQLPIYPKNTSIFGGKVDFIFTSKKFELPILGSYVHYSNNSDHLPIIVDFYMDD